MARAEYIFETNSVNGGFLVDRRTDQIVGTTSRGVDRYFVNGETNPVTGGLGITVAGQYAASVLPIVSTPIILACSSTFNGAGGFTLATALPPAHVNVWMYFNAVGEAGSVGGPAVSGWYYCIMSSTTVGKMYGGPADQAGEWLARIPSVLPSVTSTTAGANTPTINTSIVGPRILIPANTLGENGVLRVNDLLCVSNSAQQKTAASRIGPIVLVHNSAGALITTVNNVRRVSMLYMAGDRTKQFVQSNQYYGTTPAAAVFYSVDMGVDQYLETVVGITNVADWCGVLSLIAEVLPS